MAKIQNITEELISSILRKSAYSLPNNPTEAGYKASDIRDALYKPIVDITNSALSEIDRVVNELNKIIPMIGSGIDYITSVTSIYYHGSDGLVYTTNGETFTLVNYLGNQLVIKVPKLIVWDNKYYELTAIDDSLFESSINLVVPKEYEELYNNMLESDNITITSVDTVENNMLEISKLQSNKVAKITSQNTNYRAYTISPTGAQCEKTLVTTPTASSIPLYNDTSNLTSEKPTQLLHVVNKKYLDERLDSMGARITFSIDPSTYIMTLQLRNEANEVLSTGSVDLPLESIILGASYNDGVLTLNIKTADSSMDNAEIDVNISDLISGLVDDDTFDNEVERIDNRIDETNEDIATLNDEVEQKEIFAHYAFTATEAEKSYSYMKGGAIDKKFLSLDKNGATNIAVSMDQDYKLTIDLLNRKGDVVSTSMVDLPIESLITEASYQNRNLILTFQSGDVVNVDVSSIISGLVPDTITINDKRLDENIILNANDVGAYSKSETLSKSEVISKVGVAKQELQGAINEHQIVIYAYCSAEAEKASGYIKGGLIDKELKAIKNRLQIIENN